MGLNIAFLILGIILIILKIIINTKQFKFILTMIIFQNYCNLFFEISNNFIYFSFFSLNIFKKNENNEIL